VSEDIELGQDTSRPARVYGYAPTASVPVELLWPLLLAVVVGLGAFRVLERREARRRAEPPPNTVRDAVAMVGETLAATHNPDALLPVILRASVEATHAIGGTITSDGRRVASRGMVDGPDLETIDIELDVADGTPTTMTLYAPPLGFGPDARDAAAWIAGQAFIALENARLHGLVQRQAVTDDLTGLANRRRFLSQLEAEIVRSGRSGSPLGVVLADLDDFKRINDTWGHDVGDETLRRFAQILRATVRDVDLPVRLGGEEFAILLPETDLEGSAQLAERVRLALEEEDVVTSRATFRLTASFGVSCFPLAATADDVLTDADRRLYDAKRSGKNRVVVSTPFPSGHAS
jgi:diguanylate cyclase (GGDEF)-like protein